MSNVSHIGFTVSTLTGLSTLSGRRVSHNLTGSLDLSGLNQKTPKPTKPTNLAETSAISGFSPPPYIWKSAN